MAKKAIPRYMLPTVDFGELNPKQIEFCNAKTRYVAYGGARGGGKSHVLRIKAVGGAMFNPGIRILIVRREYPELEQSLILPIRKMVPDAIGTYNGSMRMMSFYNGSIIKFGHYGSGDDLEYQGQEYDWIFVDEATQFTESQFRTLGACLRGTLNIKRRMYLTCNPGKLFCRTA
jgi:phage terminase large subunit